ncbi:MAG: L-seryl-tRNA(Sec) selenium transferase [Deltaproteobacteria bacterium]
MKEYTQAQQDLLRRLPKVDELMGSIVSDAPHSVVLRATRETIAEIRERILADHEPNPGLLDPVAVRASVEEKIGRLVRPSLRPVVNATGVVVHTNLGRSLLPTEILPSLCKVASRYSNLEYDLDRGERGIRYSHVEEILTELTGAEAGIVVNNNAAAVLITLETLAKGREVVVSRGELVEIGGSFRIPDVMARSGAILREVGTTNRTHLRDYEEAIGERTALLLKVHKSNFHVVGFTKEVPVAELARLGKTYGIPVCVDLGSGTLVDLSRYGLMHEPTVQEELAAGADVVTFSGDKLLGGPQAGIILGKGSIIEKIKRNPLNRALRIDKLTLAALEAVLRLYRDEQAAIRIIPTLRMMTLSPQVIRDRAERLCSLLQARSIPGFSFSVHEVVGRVGGGALPFQELGSFAVSVRIAPEQGSMMELERGLRRHDPPVIVRMENDNILLDARTLREEDLPLVVDAFLYVHEKRRKCHG